MNRHDKIAETLGVPAAFFDTMFEARATEMKRLVFNYVKNLQGMLDTAAGMPGTAPTASKTKTALQNGFPRLPGSFDVDKYSRKELEALYRDYIGSHYCTWFHLDTAQTTDICLGVATERRTRQAPWSRIKQDTLKYVDVEVLPRPDFVLDAPWGMKFEFLREFFTHIAEQEKTFGLGEVFWFKHADATRKGGQEGGEDAEDGIQNRDLGAGPTEGYSDAERLQGFADAEQVQPFGGAAPIQPSGGAVPIQSSGGAAPIQPSGGAAPIQANSGDTTSGNQQEDNPHSTAEIHPPAPNPIPNPPTPNLAKKTIAPTKQRKSGNKAAVQNKTQSTEPPVLRTRTKKQKTMPNQPTSAHPAAGAGGAEPTPRLHPKPRPVTRTVNESMTELTGRHGEGTSNHTPGIHSNPQPPREPQGRVPHAAIDPSLLAATPHALINTSDNLALQEASRFAVQGKRVPKKKQV